MDEGKENQVDTDGLASLRAKLTVQQNARRERILALLADGKPRALLIHDEPIAYPVDCDRIVRVLAERGITCSLQDAHTLWRRRSEMFAASWVVMPDDDDVLFSTLAAEIEPGELFETEPLKADIAIGLEESARGDLVPADTAKLLEEIRERRRGGELKGQIEIAPDFDEPMEMASVKDIKARELAAFKAGATAYHEHWNVGDQTASWDDEKAFERWQADK